MGLFWERVCEERLDIPPSSDLPAFPRRVRSGPILRLPTRVWMAGERRMERMLVGHFLDRRHFCTRTMQLLVNELWHTRQTVVVVARHHNSFVFRFYSDRDLEVRRFSMWVQLYNLLFEAYTRDEREILGQALGEDVTVDVDDFFPRHFCFLRVSISISSDSTLVPGFFLDIPGGEPWWIECWYESMYKFCRACGRVGHTFPQCDLSREEANRRVDGMLPGLCERFGTVLQTNVNVPLHTNCVRAFARSNSRRNTLIWAIREEESDSAEHEYQVGFQDVDQGGHIGHHYGLGAEEQVEIATQTDLLDDNVDEIPLVVDMDQFLANYEATWDLGLQNPRGPNQAAVNNKGREATNERNVHGRREEEGTVFTQLEIL
ncbi:hypothetical protein Vadar_009808 [Vaccinium darrowii]|uniref:Uncharacterized protein n=1 Tax=Vaccinium darrowii TaxID=229202 RepID=A0ACB7YVA5_9ERIC|nr:hypothetical protein Vadar_009808 [Vaccinium darrowii]